MTMRDHLSADARYSSAQATNQGDGRGWDFSSTAFREPFNWKAALPLIAAVAMAIVGVAMCGAAS